MCRTLHVSATSWALNASFGSHFCKEHEDVGDCDVHAKSLRTHHSFHVDGARVSGYFAFSRHTPNWIVFAYYIPDIAVFHASLYFFVVVYLFIYLLFFYCYLPSTRMPQSPLVNVMILVQKKKTMYASEFMVVALQCLMYSRSEYMLDGIFSKDRTTVATRNKSDLLPRICLVLSVNNLLFYELKLICWRILSILWVIAMQKLWFNFPKSPKLIISTSVFFLGYKTLWYNKNLADYHRIDLFWNISSRKVKSTL